MELVREWKYSDCVKVDYLPFCLRILSGKSILQSLEAVFYAERSAAGQTAIGLPRSGLTIGIA